MGRSSAELVAVWTPLGNGKATEHHAEVHRDRGARASSTVRTRRAASRPGTDTLGSAWPRSPISSRPSAPIRRPCSTRSPSGRRTAAARSTRTRRTRRSRWPTGDHVVLATPTGSGKSLVAVAGVLLARNEGRRAVWTAPIKALGGREVLRPRRPARRANVGLATGDAAINVDAPVLVCTAEVLANHALVTGPAQRLRVRLPRRVPLLRRRRSRVGLAGPAARADRTARCCWRRRRSAT